MTERKTGAGFSRRTFLTTSLAAGVSAAALAAGTGRAMAAADLSGREMVFASWGGSYQAAQEAAYCNPFMEKSGAVVIQDGPMSGSKLRTMVEGGQPIWDVVDVTDTFLFANEELFEDLDFGIVDASALDQAYVHQKGIGCIVWSYNIAFNTDVVGKNTPQSWADVFDVEKFPGKRALRDRAYPMMEIALMADGVAPEDLYPLDIERAYRKLDTIKDHVIWYKSNSAAQQLFVDGEVGVGVLLNGRTFDVNKKGAPVDLTWNQNIRSIDYLVIPKGAPNAEVAQHFMNATVDADNQALMANTLAYAPVNPAAFDKVEADVVPWLATTPENAEKGFLIDAAYWRDNLGPLTERWNEWKLS
ncbi:ABC transporter substrate-binding protein [Leisingera sp. ANG-M1]|uniref:ABC transporter substrate-binding protein n=1 Tax=Leisingera sp. ANG-M1 TaxID=1577895 RepID=UPI00068C082D|nr:ABC transporter substrate-binding protein [Leisingera sp. ANG-M1]